MRGRAIQRSATGDLGAGVPRRGSSWRGGALAIALAVLPGAAGVAGCGDTETASDAAAPDLAVPDLATPRDMTATDASASVDGGADGGPDAGSP